MPKYEIVFRHIFERGQPATREVLQACRTYAVHVLRKRLGIALHMDSQGDPITVVIRKANTNSDWILPGDIRVRFPSKRSVMAAYEQQRAPVRGHIDNESRILTHDGQISQTLLPTGNIGSESSEASLHRFFLSCELLKRKDNGELPTLFRDIMKDSYEDIIMNNNADFQTVDDFIEIFIE